MTKRRYRFWAMILSLFLGTVIGRIAVAEEAPLLLADAGKTHYVIVLPKNPTSIQKSAARELAHYLNEISGAEFPIQNEASETSDSPGSLDFPSSDESAKIVESSDVAVSDVLNVPPPKRLIIGPSALTKRLLGDSVNESALTEDAIVIKRIGDSVIFSGHPKRGPLYAVDSFLEETLGCRWWTAEESFIPKLDRLEVADFDIVYAPKLIAREAYYNGVTGRNHAEFATRIKCNGHFNDIPPELGGHHHYLYFVHSFYQIIPPEKYFEDHPDWFPEIGGVRKVGIAPGVKVNPAFQNLLDRLDPSRVYEDGTQLCLTSEGLFQEMLKNVRTDLEKHPEMTIVSISQNDWPGGYCECEQCRKIAEEEGAQSGPLLRFVNRMADEIKKSHPEIYVDTLAYLYTLEPPKVTRARDNVMVRLCSIRCSFVTPISGRVPKRLSDAPSLFPENGVNDNEHNAFYREVSRGWRSKATHLAVWDYVTNFSLYLLPFPDYRVWGDNIRFFVENNALGVFEQGDNQAATGDFVQLRAWVMAKLLWNPELDQRELMEEFIAGYYAPELVPIYLAYFDLLADAFQATGTRLRIYRRTASDWLTLEAINKATELQNEALTVAVDLEAKNPERFAGLVKKVKRDRIPLDLVWLMDYRYYSLCARVTGKPFGGPKPEEMKGLASDFCARLDAAGVTCHAEWAEPKDFADFKNGLLEKFTASPTAPSVPDVVRGLPETDWINLEEDDFVLLKKGEWTEVVTDNWASQGRTVRMPPTHRVEATSFPFNRLLPILAFRTGSPEKIPACHFYVTVRAERANPDGPALTGNALSVGIFDDDKKQDMIRKEIPAAELDGPDYPVIDLGVHTPIKNAYLWVAPMIRDDLKAVYVDRVIIVIESRPPRFP